MVTWLNSHICKENRYLKIAGCSESYLFTIFRFILAIEQKYGLMSLQFSLLLSLTFLIRQIEQNSLSLQATHLGKSSNVKARKAFMPGEFSQISLKDVSLMSPNKKLCHPSQGYTLPNGEIHKEL